MSATSNGRASSGTLAAFVDHTLLKADATEADILRLCEEADIHGFRFVCVNPVWVRVAARRLAGAEVGVCSVAGFPLGATTTDVKVFEARRAVADGAREVDMVLNLGALKSRHRDIVHDDIAAVVRAAHDEGRAIVKVIIEAALLDAAEKVAACEAAKAAGAAFVKTSTGMGPGGATAADVALMRRTVGHAMGVKAAGGIRDLPMFMAMIEAGASRIGTSSGVAILSQAGRAEA